MEPLSGIGERKHGKLLPCAYVGPFGRRTTESSTRIFLSVHLFGVPKSGLKWSDTVNGREEVYQFLFLFFSLFSISF